MDNQETQDLVKREGMAAWIATTLCDRCKRDWPSPKEPPKPNQEWLCPDCQEDADIF